MEELFQIDCHSPIISCLL